MSGIQNDQVLDATADSPVSADIDFTLIAGMKPAVLQHAAVSSGGSNSQEKCAATHDNFSFSATFIRVPVITVADVAWLDGHARVVERAECR